MIGRDDILKVLSNIKYPGFSRDIVSFGMIREIEINENSIQVILDIKTQDNSVVSEIVTKVKEEIEKISEKQKVEVKMTASEASKTHAAPKPNDQEFLPNVKYKVAVASGKGGVGKSTVAVNMAVALAGSGFKTGLLDADIYGPSIPLMLGINTKPEFDGKKLIPIEKFGLKIMSLGFLVNNEEAVIWRGPLVMRAIQQLMRDVKWGELDVIIFDMPPGTGDAQLTLSQSVNLDGSVIVTTPQNVALLDAIKGVQMFRKVNVPILGIVENMSYFVCPKCNHRTDIFSFGGGKRESTKLDVELIGEVPIDPQIRISGDEGVPVVTKDKKSPYTEAFYNIAAKVKQKLES